jgi:hypothetical protein
MTQKLLTLALAALVSIGGSLGTASFANAGGPDVRFGIYIDDGHRGGPRGDYRRGWEPPPRYAPPRRGCSPRLAEGIARDMGLRRARVIDVTPRRVVVAGFDRHGRDRITFANQRGCPLIRR